MTAGCPSDLALETYLLAPEGSPVGAHLAGCPACAARLERMRELGDEFRREVFPRTVDAVEEALERRRFRWRLLLAPAGVLAGAAAAIMLVVRTGGLRPPRDYEYGVKGSGLALAVFVDGGAGARAVADGQVVPASAGIRFKVQPEKACWLWIMSVDAKGRISRLYPPKGTPPDLRTAGEVPGGAVLDGEAGPERIFAVCAPDERMPWSDVKEAASGATGGAERVRAARDLGGALAQASQATVLIEKRP